MKGMATLKPVLDLRNSAKPPWWKEGDPLLITLTHGENYTDFDVKMDDLPRELVERMYECLFSRSSHHHQREYADVSCSMPIGIDLSTALRNGATIINA